MKTKPFNFHIPVMGLAYTIDSPIKIAKYGIDTVVSIVDDVLIDQMHEFYASKFKLPFTKYTNKDVLSRANRIKDFLNTSQKIVDLKFEEFKNTLATNKVVLLDYIEMLPKVSEIKEQLLQFSNEKMESSIIKEWLDTHLAQGNIDVNIMTKIDKTNFENNEELPSTFNDAHLALKGFAESDLNSSLVLSAGMNPRLYSYIEEFEDFFPNKESEFKKKIILKVSDYRSALIQGKF